MSSYLDRIGAGLVLANPEVFGFDHVPEKLVGREVSQEQLAGMFVGLAHPEGTGRALPVAGGRRVGGMGRGASVPEVPGGRRSGRRVSQ